MPRRGAAPKHDVLPDPIYKSIVLTKLINQVMLDGKKGTAQKICYDAFDIVKEKMELEPLEVFEKAMENIMPVLEVKARRVGGATYQVPIEVRPERRQTLAIRWMVLHTRARNEKTMSQRLSGELMDAYNGTGASVKKREDMHRMAEANKAFAHYRW
ncbi:MAG: 30S ribosomal protein S7 [Clostridia bacterium]|jgi:small subunit ribosomal protein S7|nr:30S ribosomal protein S7 [Clostridia bacterium]MBT7121530.1 30S ribosomal protein S7 [Clostridia bacterium]